SATLKRAFGLKSTYGRCSIRMSVTKWADRSKYSSTTNLKPARIGRSSWVRILRDRESYWRCGASHILRASGVFWRCRTCWRATNTTDGGQKFNVPGLVCPVVIHDAKDLPKQLGIIQKLEIQDFFTVRLAEGSKLAEELEVAIKGKSPFIAKAISGAPHWK